MSDQHPQAWSVADPPPPPDPELVAALAAFPTTQLADAGDQVRVVHGIRRVAGAREVCGPACTVWTAPGDLLFMVKVTEVAPPGSVLVVDGAGREDAALMGEIFSALLKERGCAGAVVDGAVRDLDGIEEVGLAVFARSVHPATDTSRGPGAINVDVTCGGAAVSPGDVIRADVNGVVVIPASATDDVLAGVQAVAERERRWLAETAAGRGLTEVLGLTDAFRRDES
jgi:4-hydroxy-4-methyl-2-oxoglutarate aldolase